MHPERDYPTGARVMWLLERLPDWALDGAGTVLSFAPEHPLCGEDKGPGPAYFIQLDHKRLTQWVPAGELMPLLDAMWQEGTS